MSEVEFPPHVEPDGTEYIKPGHINGALLGGTTLKLFHIVRGLPVEVTYRLQAKDVIPYTYTSGNIADYGVIPKADSPK